MKGFDWILLAIGAALLYVLWEHEQQKGRAVGVVVGAAPLGIPPAPTNGPTVSLPSTSSGLTGASATAATIAKGIESAASAYTHVPLATVGKVAERAPTWAKIALPVVTIPTAAVQKLIDNPIGSVKGAASTIAHDVAHPIDTAKSAYNSVSNFVGSLF